MLLKTYNKVLLRWTTHRLPPTMDAGLSWKDLDMAEFCDEVGARMVERGERERSERERKRSLETKKGQES